jgi:phosphopantothenoylcysteine synthetase/decarboxylase
MPKAQREASRLARLIGAMEERGGIVAMRPPTGFPVPRVPFPDALGYISDLSTDRVLMALASPRLRHRIEVGQEAERAAARDQLAFLHMVRVRGVREATLAAEDFAVADQQLAADRVFWPRLVADIEQQVRAWQTQHRTGRRLT